MAHAQLNFFFCTSDLCRGAGTSVATRWSAQRTTAAASMVTHTSCSYFIPTLPVARDRGIPFIIRGGGAEHRKFKYGQPGGGGTPTAPFLTGGGYEHTPGGHCKEYGTDVIDLRTDGLWRVRLPLSRICVQIYIGDFKCTIVKVRNDSCRFGVFRIDSD